MKRGLIFVLCLLISLFLISFASGESIERGANWNKISNLDGSYNLEIYNNIINYKNGTEYAPISYGSCGSYCFRDWNGLIYRVSSDEKKAYINLHDVNDNYISSFGFGITGDVGVNNYKYSTLNFTWIWSQDYNATTDEYIFRAHNNNTNFNWTQEFHFYPNQSMKIKNTIRNNLGVSIQNAKFWYIQTVNESYGIWFNGTRYIEDTYKTGEFDSLLPEVKFEDYYIFEYDDLLKNGFNITDFYLGDGGVIGVNGIRILAVGITKGNSIFPNGYNVTMDPTIIISESGGGADAHVASAFPNTNYGSIDELDVKWLNPNTKLNSYIQFNISSIPINQVIDNSLLCLYMFSDSGSHTISAYHVYTGWLESGITWNNQPCGTNFDNNTNCNLTAESSLNNDGNQDNTWQCWNVTNMIRDRYNGNKNNISIVLHTENNINYMDKFYSKEYTDSSLWPYLNITYSPADNVPPSFSNYVESPSNNSAYVSGQIYAFNATITDNTAVGNVWIEFNGINYTNGNISNISNVYMFNISNLAAGTYAYYWWADDMNGNLNNSEIRYYTVAKTSGSVSLLLNGNADNLTIQYPQSINAFAYTSYGSVSLYRNGVDKSSENGDFVLLNVGYYNYTAVSSGNQNYSGSSVTYFANVTKGFISVNLFLNSAAGNKTLVYLNNLNGTGSATAGTIHLYRGNIDVTSENGMNVLLGAGFYEYKVNATGNSNYFDNSTGVVYYANITKADPSGAMQININPSKNESYGTQTKAIATESVTGDSDLSYSLYREGTLIASSSPWEELSPQTLNAGTYNYIFNTTGGQNYTNGSVITTLTINKISNSVSLLLNGNADNLTIQYPQQINATAGSASGIFKLFRNGTNITSENGNNVTLPAGYYEYFMNSTGGTNYLPNSTGLRFYANVTPAPDITAPVVTIAQPGEGQTFGFNESLPLNFGVVENNLDSCWYFIDDDINVSLPNCLNSTFNTTSGSHFIRVFANDSSGNVGFDENNFSVKLGAPSILLLSPNENAYKRSELGIYGFYYQPEDPNLDSCELWGDFNGTFLKNETDSSLISGSPNLFSISLIDDDYLWAVYCNDTFGNSAFTANRTLHVDNIAPNLALSQPAGEKSSRTVGLTFSVADRSPMNCWYNVYQGASLAIANTTTNCTVGQDSFIVSADASYLLNFFVEDYARNLNYTNSTFRVSTYVPPSDGGTGGGGGSGGGGGGSQPIPKLEVKPMEDIFIQRGTKRAIGLEVENTGGKFLNSCHLIFKGKSNLWFVNNQTKGLSLGEKFNFNLELSIPSDTEPGKYEGEISVSCDENEKSEKFNINVYRTAFEAEISDYEKLGSNLRVKYILHEYEGKEKNISIKYYLTDVNGLVLFSGEESAILQPGKSSEKLIEFKLPKDSFGELMFKVALDDGITKIDVSKKLFLPSGFSVTGQALSEENRRRLSIAGVVVAVIILAIFVFKLTHNFRKKTGSIGQVGHKKRFIDIKI